MAIRIRGIEADEGERLHEVVSEGFGEDSSPERAEDALAEIELDRLVAADDDGTIIGGAGAYSFRMTVPGGGAIPAAGVTWVGVLPTHRRRGVLNALMRHQLDDVATRGEPVAVLTASEASIYGRYGYGLATRLAKVRLDTRDGLPLLGDPAPGGTFRLVDGETAEPHARRLYDEVVPLRVGELHRPDHWWPVLHKDREWDRKGLSARRWVLHEAPDGTVDGFAHYRVKVRWDDDSVARNTVELGETVAPDPEVDAALVAFTASIDLSAQVTTRHRPVDDPFRLRLVDQRRYRTELVHDHLYVRVLDVAAALTARRYERPGTVVLGVDDPFRPSGSGRYRLVVADDGTAGCDRIGDLHDGDADAFLRVEALGSLYLGDVRPWQLAAAGLLLPASDDALAALDAVFASSRAPFCTLHF